MASPRIYLDHNATTPVRPEARAAFLAVSDAGGNPSSVHREGRRARAALESARADVAALFGAPPSHVCFTSGGTEAANQILTPLLFREGRAMAGGLLVGATEHAAVLVGHRFDCLRILPVGPGGQIDLDVLKARLAESGPVVLALQAANNETGVLQPLAEAAHLVHAAGGIVVCDAVQAAGRIACDFATLQADVVFLSGHKIGAGFGAGALVLREERVVSAVPMLRGGGQERGLRAGTENVAAIAAFGVAASLVRHAPDAERLRNLRDLFEAEMLRLAPEAVVFGAAVPRLPNTSAFAVPGIAAEKLMMAFDLGGIALSSGSACSSGKVGRSHVLEAMGIDPDVRSGAIRVSFGWTSTLSDVDAAIGVFGKALARLTTRPLRSAA